MDTKGFLNKILPDTGFYIGATQRQGQKGFTQKVFATPDDMAEYLLSKDVIGLTCYHACASFATEKGEWDEVKQKYKPRAASNTQWVRSQWLDIDVGDGGQFSSRKEALKSLAIMCRKLHIPLPMIVLSGKGIHTYWCFTHNYPASSFKAAATGFHYAMESVGFVADVKRTRDVASVLRPVGTHHRKADPVKVTMFRDADPIDPEEFYAKFESFQEPETIVSSADNVWSTALPDEAVSYPPSSAKEIVRHCSAIRNFATHKQTDTRLSEDHWRGLLGVLKKTVEGEKLAHHWSKKSDARYSKAETQDYLDRWQTGPATCKYLRDGNKAGCDACPHWGKIKTPLSLGYMEESAPEVTIQDALTVTTNKAITKNILHYANKIPDQTTVPFWPKGYSWDGQQLRYYERNADGVGEWVPISNTLYYPFLRYETEDKTRAMMVCALIDSKQDTWRVFDLETYKASDARQLASALAAQEVVYMPHSKDRNQKFVQDVLFGIRAQGLETTTYNAFGWYDNKFVMGDKIVGKRGPAPVFLGSKIAGDLQGDFGRVGSASEWASLVDKVYNRMGAEPYQFIIAVGIAAPLVHLCNSDMWHGIPTGVTGDSGEFKTTICKVACSFYGNPKKMMIQANDEGTTINALIQRIASMRHLPMLLDEITGRDTNELQSVLFALSNGEPKRRLRPDGTEVNPGQTWDTHAFITGNLSITNMLADSDRVKADATQVRCFEIPLHSGQGKRIFSDVNGKDLIEHQLLANNYGAAGEEFIRYVISNREAIEKELQKQRSKLASVNTGADTRERFYYDLIATTMTAAGIAKKLGLIDFDLKALRQWAMNHIKYMRQQRNQSLSTAEDYMQSFMAHLHQHTIVTKYYRDGREKIPGTENVQPPMRDPFARHATEDKRFIVTASAFNQWCRDQKVTPGWLLGHLEKELFILQQPLGGERQRICKGTKVPGVQAKCIEFNYDRLDDAALTLPDYISPVPDADEGNKT